MRWRSCRVAGGDRRRADRRDRRERRDAVVDVGAALHDRLQRRRAAGRDRALEHRGLEAVDDREDELRRRGTVTSAGCAGPRTSRPRAGAAGEQPDEEADARRCASGGSRIASAASSDRDAPRRRRQRGRAPRASRRARARGRRGRATAALGQRGAQQRRRSGPATRRVAVVERRRRTAARRGRSRCPTAPRAPGRRLERARGARASSDHRDRDGEQERRRLEERERRAVEVDADVGAREARRRAARAGTAGCPRPARGPMPWRMSRKSFIAAVRYRDGAR